VRRLKLTIADINRAFQEAGDVVATERPEPGDPEEIFIELYAALVSIPTVGRSVLGDREYRNLGKRLEPGQHAILVAANGRFSFKGSGYVRGGIFDRFQLIVAEVTFQRLLLNSVPFNFVWFVVLGTIMYFLIGYGLGKLFNRATRKK
jgi:NosR/NirI family nitrous oxide reductase transcriptional regulator